MENKKIVISQKELRAMIKEVVKAKLAALELNEGQDLSAKREIIMAAQRNSMDFEKTIIKTLDLVEPDQMPVEFQKTYLAVVRKMNDEIVTAVMNAARQLVKFPKNKHE